MAAKTANVSYTSLPLDASLQYVPTSDNPLSLTVTGKVLSLKNNRTVYALGKEHLLNGVAVREVSGGYMNAPNQKVVRYIRHAKESYLRHAALRKGFKLLPSPMKIMVVCDIHICYLSQLPDEDADNAYTTLQEALADTIIENDRQVCSFFVTRHQTFVKEAEHAKVHIFVPNPDRTTFEELQIFYGREKGK